MSWFAHLTRLGTAHVVYEQERDNSCGPSVILTANFFLKRGSAALTASAGIGMSPLTAPLIGPWLVREALRRAMRTEPEVYRIYSAVTGTLYDGTTYSIADYFPEVLRRLGLGLWETTYVGPAGVSGALRRSAAKGAPTLVHTTWDAGGAHFVCVDQVIERGGTFATACDPWDGEVHLIPLHRDKEVPYNPNAKLAALSLGRFKSRDYAPNSSQGKFSGWITRRIDAR